MPELPEVNTVRKLFEAQVLQKEIIQVDILDDHILRNASASEFKSTIENERFVDTHRTGKYFFGHLQQGKSILFHLGMTGDISYRPSDQEVTRFTRFNFLLEDGLRVDYTDPRKFSRILVIDDVEQYKADINLGIDALRINQADFLAQMEKRKSNLKTFLLNQKIIAGIGNLYADEICYQCKIHPASLLPKIPLKKRKQIYFKMQSILQLAVDKNAYYKIYPDDWFWKWRHTDSKGPDDKSTVEKSVVAGRTTYYVTNKQKLYI